MKGKIVSLITAILFGATMLVVPVGAATTQPAGQAAQGEKTPAKAKKKTTKKKPTKKKTTKKGTTSKAKSKKKSTKPAGTQA